MVSELSQTTCSPALNSASGGKALPAKKELPYSKVVIGTVTKEFLSADIQTEIVLEENATPDVQNFLWRISIGTPHCPKCLRPLDEIAADWRVLDTSPVGYSCPNCRTASHIRSDDVLKEAQALVRRDFESYWKTYQSKIDALTNNKRDTFRVS